MGWDIHDFRSGAFYAVHEPESAESQRVFKEMATPSVVLETLDYTIELKDKVASQEEEIASLKLWVKELRAELSNIYRSGLIPPDMVMKLKRRV